MNKKTFFAFFVLAALMIGSIGYAAPQDQVNNHRPDFVAGEILVKFKDDSAPFQVVRVGKGQEIQAVGRFQQRADVVYAEPNYLVEALGSDDTDYGNQWALRNVGQHVFNAFGVDLGSGTADAHVNWEEAWNTYSSSTIPFSDAIVAIVDSGVDETHPDLNNKLIACLSICDFVDDDTDPHDVYGHGTHVAGIAAAQTNNAEGIAGVAFPDNVKILPVRVLNDNGSGSTADVAAGIMYAADNGANAVNLSLGSKFKSSTMENAVNYAWNKGAVVVAAAGNDGAGSKLYPASYPIVMSVAATDFNDNTASFSNFNDEVDIAAPGVNVYSTFPTYQFTIGILHGRSQNYDMGSGTSMSTPHVAGLAALLFAQENARTNTEVRSIIEGSADDLGVAGWDKNYGWGRINVFRALNGDITPPSDGGGDGGDGGGNSCPPGWQKQNKC